MKELLTIQQTLKVSKDRNNDFGGFKYRSATDILETVKPILREVGCTIVMSDDIVESAGRSFVKATVTLYNNDGAIMSATGMAECAKEKSKMDVAQITGSASSYARKYALCGLFAIDDSIDPDSNAYHNMSNASKNDDTFLHSLQAELNKITTTDALFSYYKANEATFKGNNDALRMFGSRKQELRGMTAKQ